jgi:hypothetical protein
MKMVLVSLVLAMIIGIGAAAMSPPASSRS